MKKTLQLSLSLLVAVAMVASSPTLSSVSGETPADTSVIAPAAESTTEEQPLTREQRLELKREQKRLSRMSKTLSPVEGFESVEMFEAMKTGEVEVIIKARSAADSNLIVMNKTDKPLAIRMPATFSAVPALRQGFGGQLGGGGGVGGIGGGGGFGGGGGQQQQGIGGGIGGGGGGGGFGGGGGGGFGGGGGGGGVFNIPPGRVGKVAVKTMCLEHGKKDPRSQIDYVIQPLEALNTDPQIKEMCLMLARDEISQPAAQAAAWHVTDNLGWYELATKNRFESHMGGRVERYFGQRDIAVAQQAVAVSIQRVNLREAAVEAEDANPGTSSDYGSN